MIKAIVLCGGKGTRLRPYTYNIPKPMLPLGRKPILEFVVENLKRSGIKDLIFTVGYLQESIRKYFGNGKRFGVNIRYLKEKKELNTAGSILPAKGMINDTFVVIMGDQLTTLDMKKMVEFHRKKGSIATIGLKRQGLPIEYGIAEMKKDQIVAFKEKPILEHLVNAGIYVFEPSIFKYIKEYDDFAMNVFPKLLKKRRRITGYVFDEYWIDIGRIEDYERLNKLISIVDMVKGS
jgi:NDP-sugar pyrophosphorylase family protein